MLDIDKIKFKRNSKIFSSITELTNTVKDVQTFMTSFNGEPYDGEIVLLRYKDGDSVKSILGVFCVIDTSVSFSLLPNENDLNDLISKNTDLTKRVEALENALSLK